MFCTFFHILVDGRVGADNAADGFVQPARHWLANLAQQSCQLSIVAPIMAVQVSSYLAAHWRIFPALAWAQTVELLRELLLALAEESFAAAEGQMQLVVDGLSQSEQQLQLVHHSGRI